MRKILCGLAMVVGLAGRAEGQRTMDQGNGWLWFNYANPDPWLAQTFTPTVNNITGISAGLGQFAGRLCSSESPQCPQTYSVYLSLWNGAPNQQTSQMLAGSMVTYANKDDYSHADLFFSPLGITPGATYWIVMGMPNDPAISWWFHVINPYERGTACFGGTNITDTWSCDQGSGDRGIDFDFQTFYDASIVPEPSTWALMGAALIGLWAMRRKRAPTSMRSQPA